MSAWDDLVTTAVVGTARRDALPVSVVAAVGTGGVPGSPPEQVLVAAALLAAQRRAGCVPPRAPVPAPLPAPEDGRPQVSNRALEVLGLLLGGDVAVPGGALPLIAEWLQRAGAGRKVPAAWLPLLMERATAAPRLRPAAADVAGPLGAWLAARNPEWSWALPAAPADPDAVWAAGPAAQRLQALAHLRGRDPLAALALLRSTFATDGAADRAAFVATLAQALSDADEPFLEDALDDRAAVVRAAAAELLDALPGSRRAQRMAARALPLAGTTGSGDTLALALRAPVAPDAASRRDGVRDGRGGNRAAAWLAQLVAGTPLEGWTAHLGMDPAAITRLATALTAPPPARQVPHATARPPGHNPVPPSSSHGVVDGTRSGRDAVALRSAFVDGLAQAAARQRDAAWAEALLRVRPAAAELVGALPPARAHAAITALAPRATPLQLSGLLAAAPAPWPPGLSRAVVGRLAAAGAGLAPPPGMLALLATGLDPAAEGTVLEWSAALPRGTVLRRAAYDLHHALMLRRAIAEELAAASGGDAARPGAKLLRMEDGGVWALP